MAHGKKQAVFGLGRKVTNTTEGTGNTEDRGANDFEDIVADIGVAGSSVTLAQRDEYDPLSVTGETLADDVAFLAEQVASFRDELDHGLRAEEVYVQIVAGQDETGDTTIPVTGLEVGDRLIFVAVIATTASVATITQRAAGDFNTTGTSGNLTVVGNAANNTGNSYLVVWAKNRFGTRDLDAAPQA